METPDQSRKEAAGENRFVTGAEFEKVLSSAELLLHTEAFDEASIDFVQHSVSTKIADSLGSGIPLLAYGPEQVSSMKHLLRHNCALRACDEASLKKTLLTAFTDGKAREEAVNRALRVAKQYHSSEENGRQLRQIAEAAVKKGK